MYLYLEIANFISIKNILTTIFDIMLIILINSLYNF